MTEYRLLIDGELVPGDPDHGGVNPANEQVLAMAPARLAGAGRGRDRRREGRVSRLGRAPDHGPPRLILAVADRIEAEAEDLARLLTQEQGKPCPRRRRNPLHLPPSSGIWPATTCR